MSWFLAFDGGGTTSRAGLYTAARELVAEAAGGPSNPVEEGLGRCVAVLLGLAEEVMAGHSGPLAAVAAGISGAGKAGLGDAVAQALYRELRPGRVVIANDVRPVLFANVGAGPGILVVAGTGSCVLAQDADGRQVTIGGWGAFFGDEGSAYQLAASAFRAVAAARDGLGPATALDEALEEAMREGSEGGITTWAASASKREVADLAPRVTALAEQGDVVAQGIVRGQAGRLAGQVAAAQARLSLSDATPVYMTGGLLRECVLFRTTFESVLREKCPGLRRELAPLGGHRAILELALADPTPGWAAVCTALSPGDENLPPTEQRLAGTRTLDQMTAEEIVHAMNREDARIPEAVAQQAPAIAAAIEAVAGAFRVGGRLIYAGAGTSGRLGVLDAAECPPTFGVPPDKVVALIAGGERALRISAEGAEDDRDQAEADICGVMPPISAADVIVGITASGSTPYVLAILEVARSRGAKTVLICCNPRPAIAADIVIALATGPEVLAGSTRLKAGTACKLVLNMISTGAMALSGYVYEGLMVNVRPVSTKLRRRAARIVAALTGLDHAAAEQALESAGDRIAVAVLIAREGLSAAAAERRLEAAGGSPCLALGRNMSPAPEA